MTVRSPMLAIRSAPADHNTQACCLGLTLSYFDSAFLSSDVYCGYIRARELTFSKKTFKRITKNLFSFSIFSPFNFVIPTRTFLKFRLCKSLLSCYFWNSELFQFTRNWLVETCYCRIKLCTNNFNLVILRPMYNNSNYIKSCDRYQRLTDNLVTFSGYQLGIKARWYTTFQFFDVSFSS